MAKEKKEGEVEDTNDGIVITDPETYRPSELPLVVKLPEGASLAQVEFAKVLNAYAYQNPEKWADKKEDKIGPDGKVIKGLISQLKDLKNAPDPVEDNFKINQKNISS